MKLRVKKRRKRYTVMINWSWLISDETIDFRFFSVYESLDFQICCNKSGQHVYVVSLRKQSRLETTFPGNNTIVSMMISHNTAAAIYSKHEMR